MPVAGAPCRLDASDWRKVASWSDDEVDAVDAVDAPFCASSASKFFSSVARVGSVDVLDVALVESVVVDVSAVEESDDVSWEIRLCRSPSSLPP